MKKSLLLGSLFLSLFHIPSWAQLKGFSFGPYIEAAWPKGSLEEKNGKGIGIGLAANLKLSSHIVAMGSAGMMRFGRKAGVSDMHSSPVMATPLRAGIKYKLPVVFFKLESGAARFTDGTPSALILSPGIGFRILGLDVQGSYETWMAKEAMSFASLRLAYHF